MSEYLSSTFLDMNGQKELIFLPCEKESFFSSRDQAHFTINSLFNGPLARLDSAYRPKKEKKKKSVEQGWISLSGHRPWGHVICPSSSWVLSSCSPSFIHTYTVSLGHVPELLKCIRDWRLLYIWTTIDNWKKLLQDSQSSHFSLNSTRPGKGTNHTPRQYDFTRGGRFGDKLAFLWKSSSPGSQREQHNSGRQS